MSPWEVLGIREETTDPKEIRRAYAAKVREHLPDVDAEGFRLVRAAYEFLRDGATVRFDGERRREPEEDAEPPAPPVLAERETRPDPGGESPIPRADAPLRESRPREAAAPGANALDAVRAAAALPAGEARDARLRAAILALADRMHEDPRLVAAWSRAVLETEDPERPWLIASSTRQQDVVKDIFEADGEVAGRVITLLRERGHFDHLVRLARAVLDTPGEPRQEVGRVLAFLAASIAIVACDLGQALADRVFRSAARKEEAIPDWLELDRRLAAGREARGARPEVRDFLAARADALKWDQAKERRVAMDAARHVARLDPSAVLRGLLDERAAGLVASADARYPRRAPRKAEASSGWRYVALVVVLCFGLYRACSRERPDTKDWRKDHERLMRETDDLLRGLREKHGIDPSGPPADHLKEIREKYGIDPPKPPADKPPTPR